MGADQFIAVYICKKSNIRYLNFELMLKFDYSELVSLKLIIYHEPVMEDTRKNVFFNVPTVKSKKKKVKSKKKGGS